MNVSKDLVQQHHQNSPFRVASIGTSLWLVWGVGKSLLSHVAVISTWRLNNSSAERYWSRETADWVGRVRICIASGYDDLKLRLILARVRCIGGLDCETPEGAFDARQRCGIGTVCVISINCGVSFVD